MDYYQHFGLRTNPFEMVGQPTSLYMSKAHREGLAALEWGLLHEPGSFTLLMGEVGAGKTTLINVILSRNYDYARIAYLMNPKLSFEEMLRSILEQLGYLPTASTKLDLLKKFEWLFAQLRAKERIAIIIDEAQGLSDDTLEELRLFSNYGRNGKGHLEIMLVGQPELLKRLMSPSLRQFHQRIGARALLNPLQRDEAMEYVDFKLQQSGGSAKKVFAQRALAELVDHSQGIPRQLNLLCNNALIRAYAADLPWVTLRVAQAAIKEYENLPGMSEEFHKPFGRRALHSVTARPAALLTGLGFIVLAGLYCLGVGVPAIRLTLGSESASTNATQYKGVAVDNADRTATAEHPDAHVSLGGTPAREALGSPASRKADSGAAIGALNDSSSAERPIGPVPVMNSAHTAQPQLNRTRAFSVQNGDTIEGLAHRYFGSEVNIRSIVEANPQLADVNRIYPGQTIFLPAEPATRRRNERPQDESIR
jgi:general secretion pathway protein A